MEKRERKDSGRTAAAAAAAAAYKQRVKEVKERLRSWRTGGERLCLKVILK